MRTVFIRSARLALCGVALAIVASCGGSGGDNGNGNGPPAASNSPPDSASASVQGLIDYLKILVVTMPNTTEPLNVDAFVAPTTDTAEPDLSI